MSKNSIKFIHTSDWHLYDNFSFGREKVGIYSSRLKEQIQIIL